MGTILNFALLLDSIGKPVGWILLLPTVWLTKQFFIYDLSDGNGLGINQPELQVENKTVADADHSSSDENQLSRDLLPHEPAKSADASQRDPSAGRDPSVGRDPTAGRDLPKSWSKDIIKEENRNGFRLRVRFNNSGKSPTQLRNLLGAGRSDSECDDSQV